MSGANSAFRATHVVPMTPLPRFACVEVGGRYSTLHYRHHPIDRTEAHGLRKMRDRHLGIAETNPRPPAYFPRVREVRIERARPIDENDTGLGIAAETIEYIPPVQSATASSGPNSTACRASRTASAISCERSIIQRLAWRGL